MSRKWLLFLFCLLLAFSLTSLGDASVTLRLDESNTRILFSDQNTIVILPIANPLGQKVDARIKLELVDPDGGVRAATEHDEVIKPGANRVSIPVKINLPDTISDLLWYRLYYQIAPSASAQFDSVKGVISLSGITPDIFSLYVAAPEKAQPGANYRLRVRAAHPQTNRPVTGVDISAEIEFDDHPQDIVLKQQARTGRDGFATLDFQLPNRIEDSEGDITVKGILGVLNQSAESEVSLDDDAAVLVSTDKPIYQPGQILHTRILMFSSSRRALAGQEATLKILDPERSVVFRADLTGSRFGVAGADWPIPENTRLGDYRIEVETEGERYEGYGGANVKVSRYDLPNFSLEIKPDRPYYLPGQDAAIEVRANYLFGQPVKRGHVRVVRETERRWNYREQKYDTEEGDKYEGDVDAEGRFIARIDLTPEHAKLKDEDYSRYSDLTYAAYFTDATTNRTEQRRFDLRLTKSQIHLYVVREGQQQSRNFPVQFYLSATYADGSPASCDVAVSRLLPDVDREQSLRTFRTNSYGLAKINLPPANGTEEDTSLRFRARDTKGATGEHTETIDTYEKTAIRIETDKALYRHGDPIRINVSANRPELVLALDFINQQKIVHSQFLQLRNGQAAISIPYRSEFTGAVTISAYSQLVAGRNGEDGVGTRTVLYPHDRDLQFTLALNQESYRPGDEANASFVTRAANGRGVASALGVLILDKAVEERARTDRAFGSSHGFNYAYCYLNGCDSSVGGITRAQLDKIDLSRSLPEGLDLVAEVILLNYNIHPRIFQSQEYERNPADAFADLLEDQRDPLKARLDSEYANGVYPTSVDALRRLTAIGGLNLDQLRDPWETPYRHSFFTQGSSDVLEISSAGADKQFDSDDDFELLRIARPYFRFTGEAINRALANFHTRTGGFIRDEASLKTELRRQALEFDSLRDPWGEPYRLNFGVNQTRYEAYVGSSGPDRQFNPQSEGTDDILVWTSSIDYTRELEATIDAALNEYFEQKAQLPQNEIELEAALKQSQIAFTGLRDPWGRQYYATFKRIASYANRATIYNYAKYGEPTKQKTELTPVTQYHYSVYLRSNGPDGKPDTPDDFSVATISRVSAEQSSKDAAPQTISSPVRMSGSTGAITGIVTDPNGAAVPGVKVKAKNIRTSATYETLTNDSGIYIVKNLPLGRYEVTADAAGFSRSVITDVFVRSSNLTQLNLMLQLGAITETVNVAAAAETTVNLTSAQISELPINGQRGFSLLSLAPGVSQSTQQLATPRLREYFPETLVWQPLLETDKQGRAELKFKLADNITTWKMAVIGSTEDGQIGTIEREIRSFQPFFVEHDPPRILTEGDQISLPIVVRNYLDRAQPISLEIKPESWFSLLGPAMKRSEVGAGDAAQVTFDFRASASVKDGKQRITANGAEANDAIEKPVTVHPDGDERSIAAGNIISPTGSVTLDIPPDAIASSVRAELKIYPNLLAHVAEGVEAIMARPYGCGEQTISSTYPSLLMLRKFKQTGEDSALRAKASRYLLAGYRRLLNYRSDSGGFTYWGRGEPNLALTAYALRFLADARELIPVDDEVINQAREWLAKQQRADGSWKAYDYENAPQTAMVTAYVARVLAATAPVKRSDGDPNQPLSRQISPQLKRALDYLALRIEEIDEPYSIASYALAAIEAQDAPRVSRAIGKLRSLARKENGGAYWSLEANTPFYGWGRAGRIETTALAAQALARANPSGLDDQLINQAALFLLREKDHYGVWYSTQATINVLDTLLALLAREGAQTSGPRPTAEVLVNGRPVKTIELPPPSKLAGPLNLDITDFVGRTTNRVEIRNSSSHPASVQAVANYYVPWTASETKQNHSGASSLRLVARFDKTEARVGDVITCQVEAERIGFRGYGMMLAEIGLPPGADVDRESLELAMKNSNWSINQYDILPDRVLLYLWPHAGGTRFDFKFRPRFGLEALTAASSVYDYYNPEARVTLAPARFVVK